MSFNSVSASYVSQTYQTNTHSPLNTTREQDTGTSSVNTKLTSHTDRVTISDEARSITEKMQIIANKYDVTNLSTTERVAMAQELQDNNLMPDGVMLAMVAPLSMNQDVNQKTDYLNTMRESFDFLSNMGGNTKQLEIQRQLLQLLEQLNSLSGGKSIS